MTNKYIKKLEEILDTEGALGWSGEGYSEEYLSGYQRAYQQVENDMPRVKILLKKLQSETREGYRKKYLNVYLKQRKIIESETRERTLTDLKNAILVSISKKGAVSSLTVVKLIDVELAKLKGEV